MNYTAKFTHNLKIIILDNNDNIIDNPLLLANVYDEITNKIIKKSVITAIGQYEIFAFWEKCPITKLEENFMGDLFTKSAHTDGATYQLTRCILHEIEEKLKLSNNNNDWKLSFHIYKIIDDGNDLTFTIA